MSGFKSIYILGYSGHAYVVVESALSRNYIISGYFDTRINNENPYKLSYLGDENVVDFKTIVGDDHIFPAVGSNVVRKKMLDQIERCQLNQLCLIDKSAKVSRTATIAISTYVSSAAVINSMASIGKGCIVNSGAIIEHECIVDDFTHIAPGAILLGNVNVGRNSFIGANSVVKEGVSIGENVIIGAGSVVIKDIPSQTRWVGNPVRKIN